MWRSTPCAVKVLFDTSLAENKELFAKELATMRQLHHPVRGGGRERGMEREADQIRFRTMYRSRVVNVVHVA